MKWITFSYSTIVEFEKPVTGHQFLLRCTPDSNARQRVVSARVEVWPETGLSVLTDGYGNTLHTGCIAFEHTSFRYTTEGEVFVSGLEADHAPLNPAFRYPSPLTFPDSDMKAHFDSLILPDENNDAASFLTETVHHLLEYAPGTTGVDTTAADAFRLKTGVCQDFAHLFIAFARMSGLPARYVNGILLDRSVSHAWAEVYIDGAWVGYDPSRGQAVDEDYVRFSVGRDFRDCPIERGVFYGSGNQRQSIEIRSREVQPADERSVTQQ